MILRIEGSLRKVIMKLKNGINLNWLLIYEIVEDKLILILLASGSHSELF